MLVTLKQNYKITSSEIVDRYISAEIPNPNENKILHDIVMRNMIHGPCGDWCMVDGKCSKHYPKSYQTETTMDADGYPYYRRRDTDETFERPGGYVVDNWHVVPYSPRLLCILNSHINVEVVSSIKSVKYLYKYIYQGHDAATVTIEETPTGENVINHDEIKDHIEARYVGPVEACWRILNKHLHEKSHAIIRLPLHLPNQQSLTIDDGANDQEIANILERITMLLDYFALNRRDEHARQYFYGDIPTHYTFKKQIIDGRQVSHWEKRKNRFNCIGRMYSVSLNWNCFTYDYYYSQSEVLQALLTYEL